MVVILEEVGQHGIVLVIDVFDEGHFEGAIRWLFSKGLSGKAATESGWGGHAIVSIGERDYRFETFLGGDAFENMDQFITGLTEELEIIKTHSLYELLSVQGDLSWGGLFDWEIVGILGEETIRVHEAITAIPC